MTSGGAVYFSFTLPSWSFDARRHTLTRVVPCLQMSSEDSGNKVNSGNPFEGDSPSPSSLEGRQTPEFSWTKSFQRDSAFRQEEVAEESSRPKGERGDSDLSSSDQVEWSCTHSTSTLTVLDALKLADKYGVVLTVPQEVDRAYKPPRGHVMTSKTFLKFGVCFPLHRFFRDIFRFYRLMVF